MGNCYSMAKGLSSGSLNLSPHVCHCRISSNENSSSYYLSFVNGPPKSNLHQLLWTWIDITSSNVNQPWVLIGDFNQVYHLSEKAMQVEVCPIWNYLVNVLTETS